jgi:hypothetical protein
MEDDTKISEIYDRVISDGWGRKTVANFFGIGEGKARAIIRKCRDIEKGIVKENNNKDNEPELFTPVDIFEALREMQGRQEYRKKINPQEHGLDIEIDLEPYKDGFARLLFTGDWHFGNEWTDYKAIGHLLRYIEKNKIYFGMLGDTIESFIRPIKGNYSAIFGQVSNPDEQWNFALTLYKHFITEKILKFIITGNHDSRAVQKTGVDLMKLIDFKIPIKRNRASLTVNVGDVTYKGLLVHKSMKGRSMYNPVHELTRELRENCPDADFIVGAHTHVPGGTDFAYQGRDIPLIKIGGMNPEADYVLQAYGLNSFIKAPILYFDSKKRTTPIYMRGFYLDKVITINIEDYKEN